MLHRLHVLDMKIIDGIWFVVLVLKFGLSLYSNQVDSTQCKN